MSRRKIVVEGTQYAWTLSGSYLVVFLPKGGGGPIFEHFGEEWNCWEVRGSVTPRDVAEVIYRRVLGREPSPKKGVPRSSPPSRPSPKPVRWTADASAPQAYLVEANWDVGEGPRSQVVEVHLDPGGARSRVEALNAVLAMAIPLHPVRGLVTATLPDGRRAAVEAATVEAVRRLGYGSPVTVSSSAAPTRAIAA